MSNEVKYIKDPIKFLRDTGLLFEINRQILHPYGIAISVITPNEMDDDEVGQIMLWDSRDDKEGIVYAPDTFISGIEKTNNFMEQFGSEKLEERIEELGFVIQEHPDPHMKKNGVDIITYNPDHDPDNEESNDLVVFKVPYTWLEKESFQWFDYGVPQFLDEYTYDMVEPIYDKAKRDGVIIEEDLIRDTI